MINIGTDCSGIEAPLQALNNLKIKYKHIFSSDIDKYCQQSIVANYDPKILYTDMTQRDNKKIPDIDLYICGFPCQSFSLAGKRNGMSDKRGQIFWSCLDVIQNKLPNIFILENVKGLLNINNGDTFKIIIKSLENILDNNNNNIYNIYWKLLNTKDYGIPQNRERIFIIGIKKSLNIIFQWPIHKIMKNIDSFIDYNTKSTSIQSDRSIYMESRTKSNAKFIDLAFKNATYPNSDKYTPSLVRNGSLWCVPLHRYANITEMLALQGFSPNFKKVICNTQLKKQIGNSMSVNVLEEIFKVLYSKDIL